MKGKLLTAVACIALLATLGAGVVAAAQMTDTSIDPSEDTTSIEVVAENITNGTADVTVYETVDGTESQVATATLDTSTAGVYTDTYTYSAVNTSNTYRVVVTGDGAESLNVYKVNTVATGGGDSSTQFTNLSTKQMAAAGALLAIVVIVVAGWYFRDLFTGRRY